MMLKALMVCILMCTMFQTICLEMFNLCAGKFDITPHRDNDKNGPPIEYCSIVSDRVKLDCKPEFFKYIPKDNPKKHEISVSAYDEAKGYWKYLLETAENKWNVCVFGYEASGIFWNTPTVLSCAKDAECDYIATKAKITPISKQCDDFKKFDKYNDEIRKCWEEFCKKAKKPAGDGSFPELL